MSCYEDDVRDKIESNKLTLRTIRQELSQYLVFENGQLIPDPQYQREAIALQDKEKKFVYNNQCLVAALKMISDAGSIVSQSTKYPYTSLVTARNDNARSIEAQGVTLKWLRKLNPQQHNPDARVYFNSEQERNEKIAAVEALLKKLHEDKMLYDEVYATMREAVLVASPAL